MSCRLKLVTERLLHTVDEAVDQVAAEDEADMVGDRGGQSVAVLVFNPTCGHH